MGDWLGLPAEASATAGRVDTITVLLHLLMFVIFVGWACFFTYALIRFRRKRNPKADYNGVKSHASSYIEIIVAVAEAVLLIGFSIPFWMAEVAALPADDENPFEVRVVAQQFAWNVHYPGADGVFGRTDIDLVDDVENPLGLDDSDPNAVDDVTKINYLKLPVNRPVVIHLTSKDVIHSFAIPEFRIKQDVIPGMSIPVHFTPTLTTSEFRESTGNDSRNFEIVCSQLCGLAHYRMRGTVEVDTPDAVAEWLKNGGK
jgi:cytochrome c oxidase subunit 2